MKTAVSINLASRPFRHDRPRIVAAAAACGLLLALLAFQIALGVVERGGRLQAEAAIAGEQRRLQRVQAEYAAVEAGLREPSNSLALDQAVFLNEVLLRKGISWTLIFGDLDDMIPHNVRLVAVRPQVNLNNQVLLDMTVASQTAEPVIEMLMRLEASPLFGSTTVASWLPPSASEPLFRYRVNVNYARKL